MDHVFPEKYKKEDLSQMADFIQYLKDQGFDIDNPNYVENYLPAHKSCNSFKSNNLRPFPLVWYLSRSMSKAPKVLSEMDNEGH